VGDARHILKGTKITLPFLRGILSCGWWCVVDCMWWCVWRFVNSPRHECVLRCVRYWCHACRGVCAAAA